MRMFHDGILLGGEGLLFSTRALSGHGTLIARQSGGVGAFVVIAEQGDITYPELSRNEFDSTIQQDNIDSYIVGVFRRSPVTMTMNFIPTDPTHNETTGLVESIINGVIEGWQFTTPSGWTWTCSGYVTKVSPKFPVDGKLSADVTIRMAGKMIINGLLVG